MKNVRYLSYLCTSTQLKSIRFWKSESTDTSSANLLVKPNTWTWWPLLQSERTISQHAETGQNDARDDVLLLMKPYSHPTSNGQIMNNMKNMNNTFELVVHRDLKNVFFVFKTFLDHSANVNLHNNKPIL